MRFSIAILVGLLACGSAWAKLEIKNVQAVVWQFGAVRETDEVTPGDQMLYRYSVTGAKTDEVGKVDCELVLQVLGPDGKLLINETEPIQQTLALGGSTFPGTARVSTGVDTPAMELTLKLTINDKLSKESASFSRKFKVGKPKLAMAKLGFYADKDGVTSAPLKGAVAQRIFFRFFAVHFDKSMNKIGLTMSFDFLDEKGKSVLPKPVSASVDTDDEEKVAMQKGIPFSGSFTLNRPGKFTFKLVLKDDVTGKSVSYEAPLVVE